MPNIKKSFGEEVKHLRLEKNLGVRELAKMIPISPAYLIDIEKNNRVPSPDKIERIAKALNCDPYKLLKLAQKISTEAQEILKEEPAIGVFLRKAKESGITDWEALFKKIIEDETKKKHEKNTR